MGIGKIGKNNQLNFYKGASNNIQKKDYKIKEQNISIRILLKKTIQSKAQFILF